jgi:hypothetical protein
MQTISGLDDRLMFDAQQRFHATPSVFFHSPTASRNGKDRRRNIMLALS